LKTDTEGTALQGTNLKLTLARHICGHRGKLPQGSHSRHLTHFPRVLEDRESGQVKNLSTVLKELVRFELLGATKES